MKSGRTEDSVRPKRSYHKTLRVESERFTLEAILDAAYQEFSTRFFDRVALKTIAENSGVTVQTVIRRFGSKPGLLTALVEREMPRILATRAPEEGTSLEAAVDALVEHYERDGDTVLNFVAQEHLCEPIR